MQETVRAAMAKPPRRLVPTLIAVEAVITPAEILAVAAPLSIFFPALRSHPLLVGAAGLGALLWAGVVGLWLRPLVTGVRPHAAVAAYRDTQRLPGRALRLRLLLWLLLGGCAAFTVRAQGWLVGFQVLTISLLHGFGVSLIRWALQKRLLRSALTAMRLEPSWAEFQADTLFDRLAEVSLVLGAATAGFLGLFVYSFVPISASNYLYLETYFPWVGLVLGAVWYFAVAPRYISPLAAYLRASAKRVDADRTALLSACQVGHRLPSRLALIKLLFFVAGALLLWVLGLTVFHFSQLLAALLFAAVVIVTLVTSVYEMVWARAVLRPVVAHLMAQPGAERLEVQAPSLRRKMLLSFGGVLVATVALPLFWTYLQHGSLRGGTVFFFATVLAIALGFVILTSADLIRPLATLEHRAAEMAQGSLDHRLLPGGEFDEVGRLTVAFESMRRALQEKIRAVERLNLGLEEKVRERTAALEQSNGELVATIAALKEAQNRLVLSEKLASVGQLVAGVAHEINNPLNAVVNTVTPLAEAAGQLAVATTGSQAAAEARADVESMLRVIRSAAERTQRIVQALRNFTRQDGELPSRMDLGADVEECLALLQHSLRGIDVRRELEPVGAVTALRGQLNQALVNILSNAAGALEGRPDGRIVVRTRARGDRIAIEIEDNGPGIPDDVLPRIFDPFFSTKEVGKGTGLGLSITHGIIERHGGRIDVHTGPQGTTFTLDLPRQLPGGTTNEAPGSGPGGGEG